MKRKTRRSGKKKWVAYLAPLGAIIGLVALFFNLLKDSIIPIAVPFIQTWFSLNEESKLALPILYCFFFLIIAFSSFAISRLYLNVNKPNKKYFELIDFEKPNTEVVKKSLDGILNSEKTKPFFVHVAPINEEIKQFYKKLDEKGFVWENGRPGDGKTMLAYHALYRYRQTIGFTIKLFPITLVKLKYRIYALNINRITDEKEIEQILDELDALKVGRRKIILIDDAHKLSFEDKLRYEFEEEAKEKLNGKFVWINTNYLETKNSEKSESINIDFEKFYPRLLKELYQSQNPIISEIIKNKCTGIDEAIKQKQNGRIKDPWHFNFVATKGEQRIIELLEKLSGKKDEQDILVLSIFLFSVRNIITGEKEINQTGFTNLLTSIDLPYFKKIIEAYQPSEIISDLASQDKGRFIIIENKNSLDRGFLRAPHFRLSIAIVKSIATHFSDQDLIMQMIDTSKLLLTNDFNNSKYFGIYFNSIPKYQEYFLNENKDWIKSFLTNLINEQLHVYHFLLNVLRKYHDTFFNELLTDEYITTIASKISLSNAIKFTAIQGFLNALGDDRKKLIDKLDWEKLAQTSNKVEVQQLAQLAALLNALGDDRKKLIDKLNWENLAQTANKAEVQQLSQLEALLNALGDDRKKLIDKLDWEKLAQTANQAEVFQIKQVAELIDALRGDSKIFIDALLKIDEFEKLSHAANESKMAHIRKVAEFINSLGDSRKIFIDTLYKIDRFKEFAQAANDSDVFQFGKVAEFINALGDDRKKLIDKLNWEKLAQTSNKVEVQQLSQLEALLDAIGDDKKKLIDKLDWEKLAQTGNKAELQQLSQLAALLDALGDDRKRLIDKLDWEKLAQTANKAEVQQLSQLAALLNALGEDRKKLSEYFIADCIISYSKSLDKNKILPFCIIVASMEEQKQNQVIKNIDWGSLLKLVVINHKIIINHFTYILNYYNRKCNLLNQDANNRIVREYLDINRSVIIYFSTQYFTAPDDYQAIANFLDALHPHSNEMVKEIVEKLKIKMINNFIISPRYYQSFSNLLNAIHQINPVTSNYIITNNLVWEKLYNSFQVEDFNDQLIGLQSLLKTINKINTTKYTTLCELQFIKDLDTLDNS